jgi:hypothetical protein
MARGRTCRRRIQRHAPMEGLPGQRCPEKREELCQNIPPLIKVSGASAAGRITNGGNYGAQEPRPPVAHNVLARPISGLHRHPRPSAKLSEELRGQIVVFNNLTIKAIAIERNSPQATKQSQTFCLEQRGSIRG